MDIRQIQALHAQYSQQPVIIDIAGHSAAMPALPAPDGAAGGRGDLRRLRAKLTAASRPVVLCVAVAALAGGAGISAAKIWRVMHDGVAASPAANAGGAVGRTAIAEEAPINAAPPRPLTNSDFGAQTSPPSALANVDARSLAINAQGAATIAQKPDTSGALAPLTTAAASPIRAQHGAPAPQAAAVAVPAAAQATAVAPAATPAPAPATTADHKDSPVSATSQRPALRPLRRVMPHHASQAASESAESAQPQPKPATPKGGDVQLF
ncbi:hypothetical protein SAMN05443245_7541 [Paraburkholderia fungorum]|uniref:Uncharacterized protein n=1 Tax=Paraburkholderia fungorum TaxID=134537 RepID=A0A1H1JZ59_9BURK|nr:hypothetical protein [Paraburkholderia fungorum]SDR54925.1 hypothetical protein SAMN05443245_7541 [Paraburkholderia fungorum]